MATTTTRLQLSAHFTIEEFDCHDGTRVPEAAIPALKELCTFVLEPMRQKYGACSVHSGYRTVSHNASVGGEPHSRHIYEQHPRSVAADVEFAAGTVAQWAAGARWRFENKARWTAGRRGGVGDYPSPGDHFVHVDSGPRRDWHG
jgi:uncharacterized protein YcbK (DUF882 family)